MERKMCTKCKQVKDTDEFPKRGKNKTCQSWCTFCSLEYRREWGKRNKRKVKDLDLQYKYGITIEDLESMRILQRNECDICGKSLGNLDSTKDICVDHDHSSGQPRGLLCNHCNFGLGHFKDSKKNLGKAIEYLEKYKEVK